MIDRPDEDEPGPGQKATGYGRPPPSGRFRKGQSGNPKGRPRNRHRAIPYHAVLGQMVTVREDGRERRVTAAEAFLLQLTRKGLAGDGAAARASLAAIEEARARQGDLIGVEPIHIQVMSFGLGSMLENLGMAITKFPTDKHRVRSELHAWIVEAALARLGDRLLTEEEQREVWDNTRAPEKVSWPAWWIYRG